MVSRQTRREGKDREHLLAHVHFQPSEPNGAILATTGLSDSENEDSARERLRCVHIHKHLHKMCMSHVCIDMCIDMRMDMCVDMRIGMCINMCIRMLVHICE